MTASDIPFGVSALNHVEDEERTQPSFTSGLLSLPPELLGLIIDHSRPNGFQSLMLTCKAVYRCGQHLVATHNDLMKELKHLNQAEPVVRGQNMFVYFQRILEVPELVFYITSINVSFGEIFHVTDQALSRQMALFSKVLNTRPHWSCINTALDAMAKRNLDHDDILKDLKLWRTATGSMSTCWSAFQLMLLMLPNLSFLEVQMIDCDSNVHELPILPQLRSVRFHLSRGIPVMFCPNITKLHLQNVIFTHAEFQTALDQLTKLNHLDIITVSSGIREEAGLIPWALEQLLQCMRSASCAGRIRSLQFQGRTRYIDPTQHRESSLDPDTINFVDFVSLQYLELKITKRLSKDRWLVLPGVEMGILEDKSLTQDGVDSVPFHKLLPSSLLDLTLCLHVEDAVRVLPEVILAKSITTPNLREITLNFLYDPDDDGASEMDQELESILRPFRDQLHEQGVKFSRKHHRQGPIY